MSWPTAIWESRCGTWAARKRRSSISAGRSSLTRAFAPAQTNLGQTLLDLGNADEALPHGQEAVRLDPNSAVLHHNLGNTLRVLERLVDAKVSYLEALRLDPKLALSNAHLGLVLQKEGQLSDALVWLKKAVELEPGNIDFWQWLAELHDEMEESAESLPCWERVVAPRPRSGGRRISSLGWACRMNRGSRRLASTTMRPSQLQPEFAAAYLNLGGLQEELGDMAAAERIVPHRARETAGLRVAACTAGNAAAIQAGRSRPGRPGRATE